MKVKSRVYRGIEYVYLHDLPTEQQALLNGPTLERIKILMNGVIMECISYHAYAEWFKTIYKAQKSGQEELKSVDSVVIPKENH